MKKRAGKNKLLIPLTIVTLIIWGAIIYNIIEYYSSNDNEAIEVIEAPEILEQTNIASSSINDLQSVEYLEIERDPFKFMKGNNARSNKQIEPTVNPNHKKPLIPPINNTNSTSTLKYSINGVLINNENKLVVFEDLTNDKVVFLRENENYLQITIKEIGESKVSLLENGNTKEIDIKK